MFIRLIKAQLCCSFSALFRRDQSTIHASTLGFFATFQQNWVGRRNGSLFDGGFIYQKDGDIVADGINPAASRAF